MKLQKGNKKKSQKLLAENLHERYSEHLIALHSISKGGLCNPPYWLLFVPSSVAGRLAVSVIKKIITSCDSTLFYSDSLKKKRNPTFVLLFEMCLARITII